MKKILIGICLALVLFGSIAALDPATARRFGDTVFGGGVNDPYKGDGGADIGEDGLIESSNFIDAWLGFKVDGVSLSTTHLDDVVVAGAVDGESLEHDGSDFVNIRRFVPVMLTAGSMQPDPSSPSTDPAFTTWSSDVHRWTSDFDNDERGEWTNLRVPTQYDDSIDKIEIHWTSSDGTSVTDVNWRVRSNTDDTTLNGAWNAWSSGMTGATACANSNTLSISTIPFATLFPASSAGDPLNIQIELTAHTGVKIRLLAVYIEY